MTRRGLMLVLSSPSGAGKTTVSRRLLEAEPDLVMSVSATTRKPRPAERDGVDYHFMDVAEFERQAGAGAFLEHATVFGNSYGTPGDKVEAQLASGRDILFDIDWQGAQALKEKMREQMASVFILPPSMAALERRLKERAQDSEDVVRSRMARAVAEMSHWAEYDYVLVNDDLDQTVADARTILAAERLKRIRRTGLTEFVRKLQ